MFETQNENERTKWAKSVYNFHNNRSEFEWQHRIVAKRNDLIQWFIIIICILAFYYNNLSLMCVVCRSYLYCTSYMTTDYINIFPTTRTTRSFIPILWMKTFLAQHLKERGCFPNIVAHLSEILKLKTDISEGRSKTATNKQTKKKTKRSRQRNGIIYLKDC